MHLKVLVRCCNIILINKQGYNYIVYICEFNVSDIF